MNLKPGARELLQQILKSDPAIVETDSRDLLPHLWESTHSIAMEYAP